MEKEGTHWSYRELLEQKQSYVHDIGNGLIKIDLEGMKELIKHEKFCPHHVSALALSIYQYRSVRNNQIILIAKKEHLAIKNRDC